MSDLEAKVKELEEQVAYWKRKWEEAVLEKLQMHLKEYERLSDKMKMLEAIHNEFRDDA